jgi:RNA polymerase sigma factor (sigma-70 family)
MQVGEPPTTNACSVRVWDPFRSEREHVGQQNVIVLLIGTDREFTRDEYFVGCNALALHETGIARLIPVFIRAVNLPLRTDGATASPWESRYRTLLAKLCNLDALDLDDLSSVHGWDRLRSVILMAIQATSLDIKRQTTQPATVVFSYSHRDDDLRGELDKHLSLLERTGLIKRWHDRRMLPGDDWAQEIDVHLYTADLILLLISADFFASDYCYEVETPVALKRHKLGVARAIPVLLRPVTWRESALSTLQALPTDARPVTTWTSMDLAFVSICEGVLASVLRWRAGQGRDWHLSGKSASRYSQRSSTRKRLLDAALPSEVEVGRATMLVALVRASGSAGLRGLVAVDATYGVGEQDVQSVSVSLRFPISGRNKPEPLPLTLVVTAPEFDPPRQQKGLLVRPEGDSPPLIFLLSPLRSGLLTVVVEIYENETLVAACPVRTHATESVPFSKGIPNIVSSAFDVNVQIESEDVDNPRLVERADSNDPQHGRDAGQALDSRESLGEATLRILRERLLRFGQSKVGQEVAEDLTQDTLMLIAEKYSEVKQLSELVPLAIRIMQLKLMGHQRSAFRRHEHNREDPDLLEVPDLALRPDEVLEAKEFATRMAQAFRLLGPKCREILRLRFLGMSTEQIQDRMGITDASRVNLQVFRCRNRLRQLMSGLSEVRYEPGSLLDALGRFDFKETGSATAPLTCEVYTDYECPASARLFLEVIPQLVTAYVQTGRVKLVHRDFPLPQHRYARIAARYANAAGVLGQYNVTCTQMFRTQDIWSQDGEIDTQVSCVIAHRTMQRVRQLVKNDSNLDDTVTVDLAMGRADNVRQTPTLVVVSKGRREVIIGDLTLKRLQTCLDEILSRR